MKKQQISIRLPVGLLDEIEAYANKMETSRSEAITALLREGMGRTRPQSGPGNDALRAMIESNTSEIARIWEQLGGPATATQGRDSLESQTSDKPTRRKTQARQIERHGKLATIREHLLDEFPDLTEREIKKAKDRVNRKIKGRKDVKNPTVCTPQEALEQVIEQLRKH